MQHHESNIMQYKDVLVLKHECEVGNGPWSFVLLMLSGTQYINKCVY